MFYDLNARSSWERPPQTYVNDASTNVGRQIHLNLFTPRLQRALDMAISIPILTTILPVLVLLAAAIKLDSRGPILFLQPRIGLGNKTFLIYKFRSMHSRHIDLECAQQTTVNDIRVTRVGRFIRASSLDELPQLFNVLRGDMSLVGPRPHAVGTAVEGVLLHNLVPDYCARHSMRPGITGWAQINGSRGPLSSRDEVINRYELDMHLIRNWSVRRYFGILLRTTSHVLRGTQAY
jgi:lipopolysaccharide/colanic/teichoic acid biosynthesis glycosyltransferase